MYLNLWLFNKSNESNEDHLDIWVLYNVMCKERVRWSFSLRGKRQRGSLTVVCSSLMHRCRGGRSGLLSEMHSDSTRSNDTGCKKGNSTRMLRKPFSLWACQTLEHRWCHHLWRYSKLRKKKPWATLPELPALWARGWSLEVPSNWRHFRFIKKRANKTTSLNYNLCSVMELSSIPKWKSAPFICVF